MAPPQTPREIRPKPSSIWNSSPVPPNAPAPMTNVSNSGSSTAGNTNRFTFSSFPVGKDPLEEYRNVLEAELRRTKEQWASLMTPTTSAATDGSNPTMTDGADWTRQKLRDLSVLDSQYSLRSGIEDGVCLYARLDGSDTTPSTVGCGRCQRVPNAGPSLDDGLLWVVPNPDGTFATLCKPCSDRMTRKVSARAGSSMQ